MASSELTWNGDRRVPQVQWPPEASLPAGAQAACPPAYRLDTDCKTVPDDTRACVAQARADVRISRSDRP